MSFFLGKFDVGIITVVEITIVIFGSSRLDFKNKHLGKSQFSR